VNAREMKKAIAKVEEANLRRDIFHLSEYPLPYRKLNFTRPGQHITTLDEADAFIAGQLEGCGYTVERESVQVQAFRCDRSKPRHHWYSQPEASDPWHAAHNLYAKKRGVSRPDEFIYLLSHKDSPSWLDCPGAYDNAVGTAGNLEIARVLAGMPTARSVWFVFCNEEHWPWTSITAAENAKARSDDLVAILNTDSIGGKSQADVDAGRHTNVSAYTKPEGKRLAELMVQVNDEYEIGLVQSIYRREAPGDDDGSFVNAGYPAAIINVGSFPFAEPNYHEAGDTADRVDVTNVRQTVQATLAAVLTLDSGL
jgi:hypothetical protein